MVDMSICLSELHRYVLLVYKQKGQLNFSETRLSNTSGQGRKSQSASTFALKYNMEGPVAGNFFQAEFDDYCPLLYKQLGSKWSWEMKCVDLLNVMAARLVNILCLWNAVPILLSSTTGP